MNSLKLTPWLVFLVAVFALPTAWALDANSYGIVKQKNYVQADAGVPTAPANSGFAFSAFVDLCSPVGVTNASLQLPALTVTNLSVQSDFVGFEGRYDTKGALDAAYPNGDYNISIGAVTDGGQLVKLVLATDNYPSTIPHISNYAAAQNVNPNSDFTLTWDALSGGTTNDFIQVQVEDSNGNGVFSSVGIPKQPGALNGTDVAFKIPAFKLVAGRTYQATLFFARGNYTNTYAGVVGIAAYALNTSFTIRTIDVTSFLVAKGRTFDQTSAAAPVSQSFVYLLNVNALSGGNAASVVLPSTATITLPAVNGLAFEQDFGDQISLDAAYPNGVHTFNITGAHDGAKSVALNLSGLVPPANTPRISNFTAAQTINSRGDFTLTWDAFSGGTASDFISVSILDSNDGDVFGTPGIGETGALNGLATAVVIPRHTLAPGNSYTVQLIYAHGVYNTSGYAGATGAAAFYKLTHCPIRTVDVGMYGLVKQQTYLQSGTGAPVFSNAFFNAFADDGEYGYLNSATVTVPVNNNVRDLPAQNGFSLEATFADKASMDANSSYPNGSYVFNFNAVNDGLKTATFNLSPDNYPNTPHLSNFTAAQAIHSGNDFTLTWDAPGGTVDDFLEVRVIDPGLSDDVLRSPQFGSAGTLNGTSTSMLIPANTLRAGRTYYVRLFFVRLTVDKASYLGSLGVYGFAKETDLPIRTSGTINRPRILLGNQPYALTGFQMQIRGEEQRDVIVERASSLLSTGTGWTPIGGLQLLGGQGSFKDNNPGNSQRYYRVREGVYNPPPQ